MRNTAFFLSALFLITACQSKFEIVEIHDENGRLMERYQILRKDSMKNGTYERFYESGAISEQMTYKNNLLEGEHTYFHENGKIDEVQFHTRDKLNGMYSKYYENGQIKLELPYVHDVISGEGKGYYENGQVKEIVNFESNEENGPFTEYYENGNLKATGFYKEGDYEQDTLKMYNQNGILERVMFCESGRCSTLWKSDSAEN